MKDSSQRIDLITEYLANYKVKIELKNKAGLFDDAKLYELFACKVCEIWFGKKFINANETRPNYPFIDLFSDDHQIFVQVTTQTNIPVKVKATLQRISINENPSYSEIKALYFFVLDNNSISDIKDYAGKNRIGNIDFSVAEHLITHERIINKAKYDLNFQKELYQFINDEKTNLADLKDKLCLSISCSRSWLETNINCKINNEYEINRNSILTRIETENKRFICIRGDAGTGKSALCRKLLENKDLFLCTRAERIVEESNVDNLWHLDINKVLLHLNGRKIFFFVDALEFIADSPKTKMDLLQCLLEIINQHENAYFVSTCRTFDYSNFQHLLSQYNTKSYDVPVLSDEEFMELTCHFPVIQNLLAKQTAFAHLSLNPFYIDMITKYVRSTENIEDISDLRKYIWEKVICMEIDDLPTGIQSPMIRDAVNHIAFTRASAFCNGVCCQDFDPRILRLLCSKGIIIETSPNHYRLKNDIFEDICFERFFDEEFDSCRGVYDVFFNTIEKIGQCVDRRYQIWIENKLFAKKNRTKFLYALNCNTNPHKWEQATIIGIIRSNYCDDFFREYETLIIENKIHEYIHSVNLFAFDIQIRAIEETKITKPLPIGHGRNWLIRILSHQKFYQKIPEKEQIVLLCSDYSMSNQKDTESTTAACSILEYFIEQMINNPACDSRVDSTERINSCLNPLYWMADEAKDWISVFWENTIEIYKQAGYQHLSVAKGVLEYTIKNTCPMLAKHLAPELCKLADALWIYSDPNRQDSPWCSSHNDHLKFGLNSNADHYRFEYRTITDNQFAWNTAQQQPFEFLEWLIRLTNHAAKSYADQYPQYVQNIKIWFEDEQCVKDYIGTPDFWLTGIDDRVNTLIGDCVFIFKSTITLLIHSWESEKELVRRFARRIQETIYNHANNIIMLTVVLDLGLCFKDLLPGYAMDMASNLTLVDWDFQRSVLSIPKKTAKQLEKQILGLFGIPHLKKRYPQSEQGNSCLRTYFFETQVIHSGEIRQKAERILDHLYKAYDNGELNAADLLHIQQMDFGNSNIQPVNDQLVEISPYIHGEAKEYVEENKRKDIFQTHSIKELLDKNISSFNMNKITGKERVSIINQLLVKTQNSKLGFEYQQTLVVLISQTLAQDNLSEEERSNLCSIWIQGIKMLFANQVFLFDHNLLKILFRQIENPLTPETKRDLKSLMLELLTYKGENHNIDEITDHLTDYLQNNAHLAHKFYNMIIEKPHDNLDLLCGITKCGLKLDSDELKTTLQEIIKKMIGFWTNPGQENDIFHTQYTITQFLQRELHNIKNAHIVLDLLFNTFPVHCFNYQVERFYKDILSHLALFFFDEKDDQDKRNEYIRIIRSTEARIKCIPDTKVRKILSEVLLLSPDSFSGIDGNRFPSRFSPTDKQFLNKLWFDYGYHHIEGLILVSYHFHVRELLPDVLPAFAHSLEEYTNNGNRLETLLQKPSLTMMVNQFLTIAYSEFSEQIKEDDEYSRSYESILQLLITADYRIAAVLLGEFRIH